MDKSKKKEKNYFWMSRDVRKSIKTFETINSAKRKIGYNDTPNRSNITFILFWWIKSDEVFVPEQKLHLTCPTWFFSFFFENFKFLNIPKLSDPIRLFRKHPTRQFCKIFVLRGIVSWKIVSGSYKVLKTLFWKILSVLMVFLSPGKSYVF